MDSYNVVALSLASVVIGLIVIFAFVEGRRILKGRRIEVRTPKLRARGILMDEQRFGSAKITGYQMAQGMQAGFIHLRSPDDVDFKEFYHKDELMPDNSILAAAGIAPPIWRVVRGNGMNAESEKEALKRQLIEAESKSREKDVETAVKLNRSTEIPDNVQELFREFIKGDRKQEIKVTPK